MLLRHVNRRLHGVLQVALFDIGHHADDLDLVDDTLAELKRDAAHSPAIASRQPDALADRVLSVEIRARVSLIDDRDPWRTAPIGWLEQPARDRPNSECREKLGRDLVAVRELIVDRRVTAYDGVRRERDGKEPSVQRRSRCCARGGDTWPAREPGSSNMADIDLTDIAAPGTWRSPSTCSLE